jgi:hypothetical protein
MRKNTNQGWRKFLALLCVLTLCALPTLAMAASEGDSTKVVLGEAAAAESAPGNLLDELIERAAEAGRQINVSLRFALGSQSGLPEEYIQAASELLTAFELRAHYAQAGEIGLELLLSGQPVLSGRGYLLEDSVALETSVLPDRTLLVPYEEIAKLIESDQMFIGGLSPEQIAALTQGFTALGAEAASWVETSGVLPEPAEVAVPATAQRDAATQQITVRIDGAQYKELYTRLGQTFIENEGMVQALADLFQVPKEDLLSGAGEILAQLESLQPTGEALAETLYTNDQGEFVGLDAVMPVMFEGLPDTKSAFYYDRLTQPGKRTHTIRGEITQTETETGDFSLSVSRDDSDPATRKLDLHLEGRLKADETEHAASLTVADALSVTRDEQTETVDQQTVFTVALFQPIDDWVSQLGGEEQVDDMMRTLLESAREQKWTLDLARKTATKALSGDDFTSETVIVASLDGKELGLLSLGLSSTDYTAPTPLLKTHNVTALTEEETAELSEALDKNLTLLPIMLFQKLPISVFTLLQE